MIRDYTASACLRYLMLSIFLIPLFLIGLQVFLFGSESITAPMWFRDVTWLSTSLIFCFLICRKLHRLHTKTEQILNSRERLFTMVSHDLKNPISAILMSTDLLSYRPKTDAKSLEIIRRNAQVMLGLIDSLLVSRSAQMGKLILNRVQVEARGAIQEVAGLMAPLIAQKQIKVLTDVQHVVCYCDPDRLKQILTNLLSNAIKYSPPGSIVTLKAYRVDSGHAVHFSVQDTGPGIPQDKIATIFEPFVRQNNSTGHGLGLSIVRDLVRAHGGNVWAESIGGRGTRVYFRMPDQGVQISNDKDYFVPDSPA